ncbi:hypothetical protein B0H14DRAFT_3140463 [Mycena olivaceomarginata]|nr:hypothetical protein B0H14DRAFT_3140463 [Mycena olivaceomarginata]
MPHIWDLWLLKTNTNTLAVPPTPRAAGRAMARKGRASGRVGDGGRARLGAGRGCRAAECGRGCRSPLPPHPRRATRLRSAPRTRSAGTGASSAGISILRASAGAGLQRAASVGTAAGANSTSKFTPSLPNIPGSLPSLPSALAGPLRRDSAQPSSNSNSNSSGKAQSTGARRSSSPRSAGEWEQEFEEGAERVAERQGWEWERDTPRGRRQWHIVLHPRTAPHRHQPPVGVADIATKYAPRCVGRKRRRAGGGVGGTGGHRVARDGASRAHMISRVV